jgi:hypothetical protein
MPNNNCKKGANMAKENKEKTMANTLNKKYKAMYPLLSFK